MGDSVAAGVVLAAGGGTRLRPLTRWMPKALCPVGTVPLVDLALARLAPHVGSSAVNLHHGAAALDEHLDDRVHRSFEQPEALGTAGALGLLRPWIDGRATLVTNADAWFPPGLDLAGFVDRWDGERIRLLCIEDPARGDFGTLRYVGVALLPWWSVAALDAVPSGLYEVSWRRELAAGRLDLVAVQTPFVDCGTPADYLAANLLSSGGRSVIDPTAVVEPGAVVERSVLWPGAHVAAGERLHDAIRTPSATVLVRIASVPGA
jgi:NDP-sugar pyrophosphorylase family protein